MIGLDTNVLVRYLTQDAPEQARQAAALIETQCTRERPGHIAVVVLCELVWVLRGAYGYQKSLVVEVLEGILETAEFVVERDDVVRQALEAFRDGGADFADYVIVYSNRAAGCEKTYSLDRNMAAHQHALAVG